MPDRYEIYVVFEVPDPTTLLRYARRRRRECYPPGTEDAPPRPNDVASALVESLIECKEGPSVEDLGLSYLESESGPIRDREEAILDGVRILFMRTGGQGAAWEALEKFLEAVLNAGYRQARRKVRPSRCKS